jgi:ABC-type bacteriocin/lantibiotic exporter with double-glycine peptidase domain
VIFLLGLIEIYLVIRIPFVNADLINALVYSQLDVFKHWAVILLLLFTGQLLIGFCNKYLFVFYNENMEKNIREGVFEYVLTQATSFTEKHSTGDILSRILNDTPKIKGFMTSVVLQLCFDALSIIVAFSILIHRSWVLSLIVFAFAPLAIIAGTFFKAKIGAATHEVQEKVAVFTSKAQTWVNRFGGVKIYGIETASSRQFKSESTKFTHATIRAGKWHILMSAVNAIFLGAPSVLVLVVGGYYCQQGRLSIGELFAFLTFSTYFIAPLQRIIALINVELPKAYPIYERFKEFGMTGGHCAHDSNSWNYNDERGDFTMSAQDGFTLEITSLEYEKSGFRLSIPHLLFHSGMVYGITGANGSGKSTLAKIMKGVLSFKSGKISFVNKDDMIPKSQTFLLSQNTFFFDGSLQENITLFERNNDTKKYKEIIQRLDIEKHELAFSKTVNAEQSRIFSGGEMQKVNIARLMYSNCPVLILDEPDSFTDTKTKGILKGWVKDAKQGRIIIVITHDKEFFDICDIVYSLDQVEPKHSIIR